MLQKPVNNGFTLFEMMLVLTIVAILVGAIAPSFYQLSARAQLDAYTNRIAHLIRYARGEAISSHAVVTICGSRNLSSCDGDWQGGILVVKQQPKFHILRELGALPGHLRLVWKSSFGKNQALQIAPNGFTNGQQGRFVLSMQQGVKQQKRSIIVLRTGRIRID